jgi:arabinofuranosyltransferase
MAQNLGRRAADYVASKQGQLVFGLFLPLVALVVNLRRVMTFTVDDSYISYRYARNLVDGLGLVYNAGERIEGYTNFLWTLILAGGIALGVDPNVTVKVLGSLSAAGSVYVLYLFAGRLRPYSLLPCVATWLFTSSIVALGYSVFGLETGFFVFLILGGIYAMFVETERGHGFALSAALFALAGLTRPEAPMYVGIPMLFLGRRFFAKQNLIRGLLFAAPIVVHMLFRHSYYGTWLPNTFSAKTGNLDRQLETGYDYVRQYLQHAGPVVFLAFAGFALGVVRKSREILTLTALSLAAMGYVALVGGDWMPYFRFMAPFEPFCFLLIDVGARAIVDSRDKSATVAAALFGLFVVEQRSSAFTEARNKIVKDEKVFWDSASGGVATWFREHADQATPGPIAIADIGEVGWETNYPIMDLLGLVDPVISTLPGGYTQKTGAGYVDRVFEVDPKYFVLVGSQTDCKKLPFAAQSRLIKDPRFRGRYVTAGKVKHAKNGYWCIFARTDTGLPAVEESLSDAKQPNVRMPQVQGTPAPTLTPRGEAPPTEPSP